MISVHLMGGLGNQAFQIFTALAAGMDQNVRVVFPYSTKVGSRQTYWTTLFASIWQHTTTAPDADVTNQDLESWPKYHEPRFAFDPVPPFHGNPTMLHGYFQSWRYFHHVRQDIFQQIHLSDMIEATRTKYKHYFEDGGVVVSMHFRLGDYKHLPDHHPVIPSTYYENAMEACGVHHVIHKILYFCEAEDKTSVESTVEGLQRKFPTVRFTRVEDDIPEWHQLLIMSSCTAHIIANSSYSWWGAYLSGHDGVYYPDQWFGPRLAQHDTRDLFPPSWTRVACAPSSGR